MNRNRLGLLGVALVAGVLASAKLAGALGTLAGDAGTGVVSPEVSADHKVTLRLLAPGARQVRVTGDFAVNGAALTKNDAGMWTYTTGVLPTAVYSYFFTVDGVRTVDPGNLYVTSSAAHLKSYVEVPGEAGKPDFWEVRDVPHGVIHQHRYKSPKLGDRRIFVYTPPGYDPAASKTYPVMYLFHASMDNETMWFQAGRANDTMDNLIADGKATPAILVCGYGHKTYPAGPEVGPDGELYDVVGIEDELLHGIIPLVEKEYHTGKEAKDRAILGFSMGGYQVLTIGLNNPKTFGYVAGLSSGFRANQNLDVNFSRLLADEKNKTAFKKIKVEVGAGETGNVTPSQTVDKYLTDKGVPHEFVLVPGGFHSFVSWRGYFRDFMTEIFKD